MKLASFNINGIRARMPRLVEWLEREKPDIACLQELKCADEQLPISDIEAAVHRFFETRQIGALEQSEIDKVRRNKQRDAEHNHGRNGQPGVFAQPAATRANRHGFRSACL